MDPQSLLSLLPWLIGSVCSCPAILIALCGVIFFARALRPQATPSPPAADIRQQWAMLADQLGLQFETVAPQEGANVITSGGIRLTGTWKGCPIEIRHLCHQTHEVFHTLTQKRITTTVDSAISVRVTGNKSWQVVPRSAGLSGLPTGNEGFDQILNYVGPDGQLSQQDLTDLAGLGWMNLNRDTQGLLLLDDHHQWFTQQHPPQALLSHRHPIWGSTGSNPTLDVDQIKTVLDLMVRLAGVTP